MEALQIAGLSSFWREDCRPTGTVGRSASWCWRPTRRYFEEILEFGPEAQHALSVIYGDEFAVPDAIGWRRLAKPVTVDVPFTAGFIEQLHCRRFDLGHANIDRASQESWDQAVIDRDREAAINLDWLLAQRTCTRSGAVLTIVDWLDE